MSDQNKNAEMKSHLIQELSRGTLTLAVLLMTEKPAYGYSLVVDLQQVGFDVEQNTLYPLLRRLEGQGLLESTWNTDENRPRKYYRLTDFGRSLSGDLAEEWRRLDDIVRVMIGDVTKKEE